MANNPWFVTIFLLGWLVCGGAMIILSLINTNSQWKEALQRIVMAMLGYIGIVDAVLALIPLFFLGFVWFMTAGEVWAFPSYVHWLFGQGSSWLWWCIGIACVLGATFGELACLDEDYKAAGIQVAWNMGIAFIILWWVIVLIGMIVKSVVTYG